MDFEMELKQTCGTLDSVENRTTAKGENIVWPVLLYFQEKEPQGTR